MTDAFPELGAILAKAMSELDHFRPDGSKVDYVHEDGKDEGEMSVQEYEVGRLATIDGLLKAYVAVAEALLRKDDE